MEIKKKKQENRGGLHEPMIIMCDEQWTIINSGFWAEVRKGERVLPCADQQERTATELLVHGSICPFTSIPPQMLLQEASHLWRQLSPDFLNEYLDFCVFLKSFILILVNFWVKYSYMDFVKILAAIWNKKRLLEKNVIKVSSHRT